jgi:hypothetical protein
VELVLGSFMLDFLFWQKAVCESLFWDLVAASLTIMRVPRLLSHRDQQLVICATGGSLELHLIKGKELIHWEFGSIWSIWHNEFQNTIWIIFKQKFFHVCRNTQITDLSLFTSTNIQ